MATADIIIGILNNWKWPDIEGIHDFKGPLMHSANWDHSVDFDGKTAGVIGTGSTSVQIVPQLQKVCKEVQVYMRSPTWISPPFGAGALTNDLQKGEDVNPGQRQYNFTEADKKKFAEDPEYHLDFRKRIEAEINSLFGMYQQNSEMNDMFRDVITKEMHRRMGPGHEKLKSFIIPKWSPGCRRISPGDGYLEALVQDNVTPVFGGIKRIVPEGIETADGEVYKMDILVCATGFQVAFQPAFKVINGQGKSIQEDWSNGPNLYFGVSAPRFPNFYTIVGPGATWSNGTLIPSIETTIEYSIKCMKKMQTEGIKAMAVKQEALDEIYAHFDTFHQNTVWKEECRSWFKDGKIKNRIYLWPGAVSCSQLVPHSCLSCHDNDCGSPRLRVKCGADIDALANIRPAADDPLPQDNQRSPLRGLRFHVSVQKSLRFLGQWRCKGDSVKRRARS
jgi:cation diffusion facilitator CzcD-associated flavoprotein CzcO